MVIRKILVPVDFSPASLDGLEYAVGLARTTGASLVVLHVVESVQYAAPADLFGATASLGALEEEQRRMARQELSGLEKRLRTRGLKIRSVLSNGSAAAGIVSAAQRLKANLIVMATHGRTGIAHFLMGSVAERVVRTARCPVLTVPGKTAPAKKRSSAKRRRRSP